MKRSWVLAGAGAGVALTVAACGSDYGGGAASSGGAGTNTAATGPATVAIGATGLGQVLVDGSGMTLYLFEADTGSTSTCSGSCADAWPPLLTLGAAQAGSGATQSLLGTTARSDGSTQVTYHGHPLYHYGGDRNAGETHGQGRTAFGAVWDALNAAGNKVAGGSSASPAGSTSSSSSYGY